MRKVLEQYAKHGARIIRRALGRPMSHKELKGLAYYTASYETLLAIIERV